MKTLYKVNYQSRLALKVLLPIKEFTVANEEELYKEALKIDWTSFFDVDQTFAVDATTFSEQFNHSKYVALKLKDAIADSFRNKLGERPNVDPKNADLRFNVHIKDNLCTISVDSSGTALFQRGYRLKTNTAPLNEILAAGLVQLSGWDKKSPLIDPMCGSGTILIEATMAATNIPAQYFREYFCFMGWKSFKPELWEEVKREAAALVTGDCPPIFGSDTSAESIEIAKLNLKNSGFDRFIEVRLCSFEKLENPYPGNATLIMNPPYGERIGEEIIDLYKNIGDCLKTNFTDCDAWIISSNIPALKKIGLKTSRKIPMYNGSLECRFNKYEMYKGTRRVIDEI